MASLFPDVTGRKEHLNFLSISLLSANGLFSFSPILSWLLCERCHFQPWPNERDRGCVWMLLLPFLLSSLSLLKRQVSLFLHSLCLALCLTFLPCLQLGLYQNTIILVSHSPRKEKKKKRKFLKDWERERERETKGGEAEPELTGRELGREKMMHPSYYTMS